MDSCGGAAPLIPAETNPHVNAISMKNQAAPKGYCPICLQETHQRLFKREPATPDASKIDLVDIKVDIVRCLRCSSVFVYRDISKELVESYYRNDTREKIPLNMNTFEWTLQNEKIAMNHILRHIKKEARNPLLDVGCGLGVFLYLARQQGWPVIGLDINAGMVKFVSEELGIKCYHGTLFDIDLPMNYYGVVTLIDVLEHFYEPVGNLKRCRELLRAGGLVVVKSPHWKMQYLKEQIKYLVGRGSGNIANVIHINQFTPNSLKMAFQQAGFDPIGIYPSRSNLPVIKGEPFNLNLMITYGLAVSTQFVSELCFKIMRLNPSFNLLGIARKPANH